MDCLFITTCGDISLSPSLSKPNELSKQFKLNQFLFNLGLCEVISDMLMNLLIAHYIVRGGDEGLIK